MEILYPCLVLFLFYFLDFDDDSTPSKFILSEIEYKWDMVISLFIQAMLAKHTCSFTATPCLTLKNLTRE